MENHKEEKQTIRMGISRCVLLPQNILLYSRRSQREDLIHFHPLKAIHFVCPT